MNINSKDCYINKETILMKFLGSKDQSKYDQLTNYIFNKHKQDRLEVGVDLISLGKLIGRFEYKYNQVYPSNHLFNLLNSNEFYVAYFEYHAALADRFGFVIVESKTETIMDSIITVMS